MLSELIVGRYRVEKELGRGGMGVVLRAYDTWLRRVVALKLLPPDTSHNPELSRRLAAEARAASALNHPGIATVYDFVEQNDASFVVYEYVEGQTFRDKLAQGRFTTEEVLSAGMQLSDALLAAHTRGIIHRDLKPENIMWTPDDCFGGRVKILDFGLAKCNHWPLSAGEENAPETVSIGTIPGLVIGTMNYMAPEQLEGLAADARSDIYALGLVLYEMATGANPFLGRTRASTIANILRQEAPSVRQQNPAAPADLDRILLKCLRKLPQERYHSAAELLIDFRNVEQHRSAALVNDRPGEVEPPSRGDPGAVGFLWLCPPFPASCPSKSTVARRGAPPSQTPPCRFPAAGSSSGTPRARAQACVIRGGSNGCCRRMASNRAHVSPRPRVRRLSHLRQVHRTVR